MTLSRNARISGATLLVYIAAGITAILLHAPISEADGVANKLATIAGHALSMNVIVILGLVQSFSALVLAVSFHGLTRHVDADLAKLGMIFRSAEGIIGGLSVPASLALMWLATTSGPNALDAASSQTLGAYLLRSDVAFTAAFFSVGSLCFTWLLLRGRLIPAWLAWTGVIASAILVVGLPLQLVRMLPTLAIALMWIPMIVFEVPVALYFLIKRVRPSSIASGPA